MLYPCSSTAVLFALESRVRLCATNNFVAVLGDIRDAQHLGMFSVSAASQRAYQDAAPVSRNPSLPAGLALAACESPVSG